MWFEFFASLPDRNRRVIERGDPAFWKSFMENALGVSIRDNLRIDIVNECVEANPFVLFALACVADLIATGCENKVFPDKMMHYFGP